MNCQEIKTRALILAGLREMPDAYVLSYINEIMQELAVKYDATAAKKKNIYIDAEKSEWIDLPEDCLSVKRCINEENNYVYDEFLIENQQISFAVHGSYKIECIAPHCSVKDISETPGINIAFHDAIACGVAFKETNRIFMHEDMFQGNNKTFLLQEYSRKATEANIKLLGMKKSRRRINYAPFF